MAEKRARPTVLPKKEFLLFVQNSFNRIMAERNVVLSRVKAEQFHRAFMEEIVKQAVRGPFSVRGIGRYYVITGRKGNRYLRFKTRLT